MIYKYGLNGKDEAWLVEQLIEQLLTETKLNSCQCVNICGIQPYTRRKREIDCLMILNFNDDSPQAKHRTKNHIENGRRIIDSDGNITEEILHRGHKVFLKTILATIEIKQHSAENIKIEGEDLFVRYNNTWQAATSKFIAQAQTSKQFLEKNAKTKIYHVNTFIYLPNVRKSDLNPKIKERYLENAIIYADSNLNDFVEGCIYQQGVFAHRDKNYSLLGDSHFNFDQCKSALDIFYRGLKPGILEQEKLEIIGKKYVDSDRKWVQSIGSKMIAFTGLAGTGKTLKLLRTANDLLEEYLDPVLFLTFNRALARDLERLMELQNLSTGSRITVWTIDSFIFKLAYRIGLFENLEDFIKECRDESVYESVRELVLEKLLDREYLQEIRDKVLREFTYVAIDEGQDWLQVERDIILAIFEPQRVILAAGTDQCLRAPTLANWKKDAERRGVETSIIPSRVSLRQTSNINRFNNILSDKLELNWSLSSNPDLTGGDIYFFDQVNEFILDEFFRELQEEKKRYYPIDYLIMTSPASQSPIIDLINRYGYTTWDGISNQDRDSIPKQTDVRCVSTHSCRGLEGWSAMILDLDRWLWFAIQRERAIIAEKEAPDFFEMEYLNESPSADDLHCLKKWFLIPFTRAKRKIFVELPKASLLREKLLEIKNENSDFVHLF